MKILHFDCFSGISGDMTIGALLDAGGDWDYLLQELQKLPLTAEYELERQKTVKNGLSGTKFYVHYEEAKSHRHYSEIEKMIQESELTSRTKEMSLNIFRIIAKAEAKIHHVTLEKVHFHEVGAIDSIIDIVGTAILLENLGVEQVTSSPVPLGSGKMVMGHGLYPVPAPATLEILKDIPIEKSDIVGELTTPTGAAIIKALATSYGPIPSMIVEKVGYGAGEKSFLDRPNMLRMIIGSEKK